MNHDDVFEEAITIIMELQGNNTSHREGSTLEFKQAYTSGPYERFAKSVASFSNNTGGLIIFGVKDSPHDPIGIQTNQRFNQDRFREIYNNHFYPEVDWEFKEVTVNGKNYGLLSVSTEAQKPVVCTKNYPNELVDGVVYFRYRGNNLPARSANLIRIVERRLQDELMSVSEKINVMTKVGALNSAIVDLSRGRIINQGNILHIDNELLKKMRYIRKGKFSESGKATLRIIGDVTPVDVRPSGTPDALPIKIDESNFRQYTPLETEETLQELSRRIDGFRRSNEFWAIWKELKLKQDGKTAYRRRLNPENKKEPGRWYFSPEFIELLAQDLTSMKVFEK